MRNPLGPRQTIIFVADSSVDYFLDYSIEISQTYSFGASLSGILNTEF